MFYDVNIACYQGTRGCDDGITLTPSVVVSFIRFFLVEDVKFSALGRHPKIISLFSFLFLLCFQFLDVEEELHYGKGARARNLVNEHQCINEFF